MFGSEVRDVDPVGWLITNGSGGTAYVLMRRSEDWPVSVAIILFVSIPFACFDTSCAVAL